MMKQPNCILLSKEKSGEEQTTGIGDMIGTIHYPSVTLQTSPGRFGPRYEGCPDQ